MKRLSDFSKKYFDDFIQRYEEDKLGRRISAENGELHASGIGSATLIECGTLLLKKINQEELIRAYKDAVTPMKAGQTKKVPNALVTEGAQEALESIKSDGKPERIVETVEEAIGHFTDFEKVMIYCQIIKEFEKYYNDRFYDQGNNRSFLEKCKEKMKNDEQQELYESEIQVIKPRSM